MTEQLSLFAEPVTQLNVFDRPQEVVSSYREIERPIGDTSDALRLFLNAMPSQHPMNEMFKIKGTNSFVQAYEGKTGIGLRLYTPVSFEGRYCYHDVTVLQPNGKTKKGGTIKIAA